MFSDALGQAFWGFGSDVMPEASPEFGVCVRDESSQGFRVPDVNQVVGVAMDDERRRRDPGQARGGVMSQNRAALAKEPRQRRATLITVVISRLGYVGTRWIGKSGPGRHPSLKPRRQQHGQCDRADPS